MGSTSFFETGRQQGDCFRIQKSSNNFEMVKTQKPGYFVFKKKKINWTGMQT